MVFTPAMHPPASMVGPVSGTLNVALVYNAAWLLSRVVGAVALQKALLFALGLLPGWLLYRNTPARGTPGRLFGGILYQVNPFVYTRLLMGQWGLVLGYALLPVAVASTVKAVRRPSPGRCARTALWLAVIFVLSLPMGAIVLLACLVAGLFQVSRRRPAGRTLLALGAVLVLFLLLSSFWLVPGVSGGDAGAGVGRDDLRVFATRSTSGAGTWVSVLGMYGYWKTQLDSLMPRGYVPLWPLFGLGLAALALFGFRSVRSEPERGRLAGALLLLGALGFFLSLGAAAPLTGWLFRLLYDNWAFFRIFREPQKFAALLALSYACLGGIAVDRLGRERGGRETAARRWRTWLVPALLILLVCLYGFRVFGGLWGQARPVSYPRSWAQAKTMLDKDRGDSTVLYLPPYWYMTFDFAGHDQSITAPMPYYFTNRHVRLNALQVGPVKIDRRPVDAYLEAALDSARERGNLGAMLAPLNVRYVLMPLNDASVSYRFVEEQEDLEVVRRWDDLVLLENRVPTSRVVLVHSRGSWRTLPELGAAAGGGKLVGSYLPHGEATLLPDATGTRLAHEDRPGGGTRFRLPVRPAGDHTVLFGEPYDGRWRLSGDAPREQAGITCAFTPPERPGTLVITYRQPSIVAGYTLSAAGLILCLVLLLSDRLLKSRDRRKEDPRA